MNSQQMFDKVAEHLLTQNAKSLTSRYGLTGALYRGEKGMMCAIGCLIPDDLYSPKMEGIWIDRLVAYFPKLEKFIPDLVLARSLQSIHDDHACNDWKSKLRAVARSFNLSDKILERF